MSIKIKYLDNGMGVYWLGQGVLSGQDLLTASKETFESEEKLKLIKYALIDFVSINRESIQTGAVSTKADMDKIAAAINPDVVVPLVASKDVMFGLSRMWEFFVDEIGWKTKVFRSMSEAELWIRESVKEQSGPDLTIVSTGI